MKKFFLLLLATGSIVANSKGQGSCATDVIYQKLKSEHPEIAVYEAQLESYIQHGFSKLDLDKLARTTGSSDTVTYDIPIVVHVVHDYGAEDLKDDDIFNAVDYWSQVYQCLNTDTSDVIAPFKKWVGNARIRLHLATIDPNGKPTKGITHEVSYLTYNADDNAKLNDWPQNEYVNVWFIKQFGAASTGAAAYAYYPSSGASMPYYDGVIGLYSYLNYDKAIPHEFGHVFNLEHPWGNTNNPGVACGDDQVDDTPPTKGHNPVGCAASALYDITCATNYSKTYKDIHGVDSVVDYPDTTNAQNIMDYTYCQKMFTIGQVVRMRKALTSSVAGRNNLYSASNLTATGALAPRPDMLPIPDYYVDKPIGAGFTTQRGYFLCMDGAASFVFRNMSWNDTITGVSWSFSNSATVPTSTSTISVNTKFDQPGWVTLSLTATGNNTGSATLTDSQAVYVADTTAMSPWGFVQNFSGKAEISNWPIFNYYKNNFKWELYNGAGYNDGSCLRYRSFDYRTFPSNASGYALGDYDDIISPAFNLSTLTGSANINFYTSGSYTTGSGAPQDSLQILTSTNCGVSWVPIAVIKGTTLINNAPKAAEFVPTSSGQWKAQTVNIPTASRTGRTYIKFRYWPGANGNNLYLDKIEVTPYSTEVNEIANDHSLIKIYPNPSHGDCKIAFTTGDDGKVAYMIKDITGKVIYSSSEIYAANTAVEKDLNSRIFPAPGLYLITVIISDKTITEKLVIN